MRTDTDHRRVLVEGTYNFRDTGGYRAAAGRTRWGKLFRSDALHALTDAGRTALTDRAVGVIIDLRTTEERRTAPSELTGLGAVVHHAPIFDTTGTTADARLDDIYAAMIEQRGTRLAGAVGLIAASGTSPVVVHCTAGKDRTGLVIALAQLAAGVEPEDVVTDYVATEQHLRGEWADRMLARYTDAGHEVPPAVRTIFTASPAPLITQIIERLDERWGSAREYLLAHGRTEAEIDSLTALLVDTDDTFERTPR
ncbi:tyrosine-protein phosphatase [Nocardia lasii]|uniref:Tyrosine-protein phosphatase n=1 Tax=Nocardia lasii TaxID=1616107 RepID=A0ABW1JWC1_9NOCA